MNCRWEIMAFLLWMSTPSKVTGSLLTEGLQDAAKHVWMQQALVHRVFHVDIQRHRLTLPSLHAELAGVIVANNEEVAVYLTLEFVLVDHVADVLGAFLD